MTQYRADIQSYFTLTLQSTKIRHFGHLNVCTNPCFNVVFRTKNVPALISNLEASHEKERLKRQKQTDSNHVRLKNTRVPVTRSQRSSQSDSGSAHDDLFEL